MRARILTPWQGTGAPEDCNSPLLHAVLSGFGGWVCMDATSQPAENIPTEPNLYVVELTCDAPTLAAIRSDTRFKVLHTEEDRDTKPPGAEINALRQYLQANGVSGQDLGLIIAANAVRNEQARIVIEWLRTRPKKVVVVEPKPKADAEEGVPMVTIFGKRIPFCAKWTWEHVPIVRKLYHAFQKS